MSRLSKLFRWSKKIEIDAGGGPVTVYLRLIGDDVYQDARNVSLLHSKELRVKLRNPDTDDYKAAFADLSALKREDMVNLITIGEMSDYRDTAVMAVPAKEDPELPDDPTLEQQEQQKVAIEKLREDRITKITEVMEKRSKEREVELNKLSDDELKQAYINAVINSRCTEEFSRIFREYQIFRGTFDDSEFKTLSFASYEEYTTSSPVLKSKLTQAYTSLEMTGEDLKN